jgi:hypothetical protein
MSEVTGGAATGSAPRSWTSWGAIAVAAALVADVLFNINVDKGESGGTGPMIGVGIGLVVLGAVLYLAVFPRFDDAAKLALVVGILTVLALAVFWSGLPLLLAPAAFGYGLRARAATQAKVGMALAALAALLDVIAALANL